MKSGARGGDPCQDQTLRMRSLDAPQNLQVDTAKAIFLGDERLADEDY